MSENWAQSTISERLKHVAKLRGVSQTALGERAGIQKGEMSNLMRRPRPSAAKLDAIASAWGIEVGWLVSGRGPIERIDVPTDRFQNRALASKIALDGGVAPIAVQSVLNEPVSLESDPPVLWWIHRMERRALLMEAEAGESKIVLAR